MNFLPEDYQTPSTSNYYCKLQEGENRIRIMSKPIFGWEDWQDKKPIRFRLDKKPATSFDSKKPVKHFWAFIVFNYNDEQIQIMKVTQATIQKSLKAFCKDKDWGEPFGYDIKIMKTGEGVDTEYFVNPIPHKPIDAYLITCFNERRINLDAMFDNADPFSHEWGVWTPLATLEDKQTKLSQVQVENLEKMISQCDPKYQTKLWATLKAAPIGITSLEDLPINLYDKISMAVSKEHYKYQMVKDVEDPFAEVANDA